MVGTAIPQDAEIQDGAYGVWECETLGTKTPVYSAEGSGQRFVDDENSAALVKFGEGYLLADHADSEVEGGIWNCNEIDVGSMGFMVRGDEIEMYQCTAVYLTEFVNNGYLYNGKSIRPEKSGDIIAGSCATPMGDMVYLAYFRFLGTEKELMGLD